MIHEELKKLREKNNLTLKELESRVGYGTGNLSSYENGKLKAQDATLVRILTQGYKMGKKEAKIMIALWRKEEFEREYGLYLSQRTAPYNRSSKSFKSLEEYLLKEGLDDVMIDKVKKDIEFYKKISWQGEHMFTIIDLIFSIQMNSICLF